MNLIIRANQEIFEEVRDVCEALEELMKDKIEERAEERARVIAAEQLEEQINIAENRVVSLMVILSKQGRLDDMSKAAVDKEYQRNLMLEYGL